MNLNVHHVVGVKATKETLMDFVERGKQIGAGSQLEDLIYCYELLEFRCCKIYLT